MKIDQKWIGSGKDVYLVAEMSANHGQSLEQALNTVEEAAKSGADALKLQTYTADTLTIPSVQKHFKISGGTLWDGRSLYDLYNEAHLPWEWHAEIFKKAKQLKLTCFSTPYDVTAVDFLEKLDVPAYKIASFELVDLPLIDYVAQTKKSLILSTGMASIQEIHDALDTALRHLTLDQIVLLKCTSAYPALPESMNLRTIEDMKKRFQVDIGLSDHTLGSTVALGSVALGACFIEKHFTLSRSLKGPDSSFSMEPQEFKEMAEQVRILSRAIGKIEYGITEHQKSSVVFRRSLFAVKNIGRGEKLTQENVRSIRPGLGLSPKYWSDVIGKTAACDIEAGTPMQWEHLVKKQQAS